MAYNEELAARVRQHLVPMGMVEERRMFGGLTFMLDGHMCCGIVGDRLMLRLSSESAAQVLKKSNTAPMDFTGKPMPGFVLVGPGGLESDAQLGGWIGLAREFVASLPSRR
jgi:hypothetical protein